ncbi:pentatricopeptide repeat-containing protein At2g06000 isoform X1 [Gastrolobium bilobum]|uniref:pentatricopeptide repeat-containing protein At2g06000 isoform X1 n=2 Tax=Gastrolobium bilobum TaxID=150636 RepID=UPI002AB13179|nr:pentatricopeptide repeat-containing protein At2g06000 isoform X1 [Gastrolobium bilobum]
MTLLFFTTPLSSIRASKITLAHYRTLTQVRSSPYDKGLIIRPEAWFVKIVSTLFLRSSSLDNRFLGYLSKHLTPSLVLEVIKRLNNPNLGFRFFQFTRERLNMLHSFWTYNIILRSLCQAGLHSSAKLVYDCMMSDGELPDSRLLGFLVSSFALSGRFDVSKELLAGAKCNKLRLDVAVYNNFFNILVKHNKLDDAICLLRELMRSHSHLETFTFNILMRGLCRAGKIDEAFKFLNDMRSFGCSPDIVTYNTLIHGLCRINEVDRARDLLKEVCLNSDFSPNVVSYTTIISGYCKLSKMEEGTSLFDEMVRSGTKPNAFTFSALIDGFVKVGDIASALGVHNKMLFYGCPPNVVTFTSLIDGYCRVGLVNHGLDLWHEMNARNISATLYTFSVLISALCKSNRLQEARDLLRLLKQSDIVPQSFIYNPVIDGYCKSGNVDEANAIVVEMEEKCKPDKLTFTILIIGHCMKGRMHEAIGLFYKMLAAGCSPDDITVRTLSSCLLKTGMPGEAASIKEALFQNQGTSLKKPFHESTNADMSISVY